MNGQSLILSSWSEKYKDYINPEFLQTSDEQTENSDKPIIKVENGDTLQNSEPQESSDVNSTWTELWKTHTDEQYLYYKNWFYEWWTGSHDTDPQEQLSTTLSTDFERDQTDQDFDDILENFNQVMLEPTMADDQSSKEAKEQREKSSLEKTKDFLSKMGFSGLPSASSSCITNCEVVARKKKRKKKQQPVGRVDMVPGGSQKEDTEETPSNDDDVVHLKHKESSSSDKIHKKFWAQRYRLFSRFDKGIRLDEGNVFAENLQSHFN